MSVNEEVKKEQKQEESEDSKIATLVYNAFHVNKDGKEVLELLEKLFCNNMIYPTAQGFLEQFGGSNEVYSGFKAGQSNVVFWLKQCIAHHMHKDKVNEVEYDK